MTALQYLACNPTAFEKKKIKTRRGFMEELMISTVPTQGLMEILINPWPKHLTIEVLFQSGPPRITARQVMKGEIEKFW
ncbi:hypothetical protein CK203_051749 [Vitis vinifera]|uniref:Uncharacterized protein n=1 Tax=Vitis vinifera TaxID=29760 RepID=A0A438HG37_VITVI|nr:hypothetical protein CK203_051749 [Vitis vinifera]